MRFRKSSSDLLSSTLQSLHTLPLHSFELSKPQPLKAPELCPPDFFILSQLQHPVKFFHPLHPSSSKFYSCLHKSEIHLHKLIFDYLKITFLFVRLGVHLTLVFFSKAAPFQSQYHKNINIKYQNNTTIFANFHMENTTSNTSKIISFHVQNSSADQILP